MNLSPTPGLVVAISSRALFNFEEEHGVFVNESPEAYRALQLQRLEQAASPGVAFHLVRKLLSLQATQAVDVVIVSRNDPVTGLRVFRSARHHGLPIQRGVFTRGRDPWHFVAPLGAQLFLSADECDVRSALAHGIPAARVFPQAGAVSGAPAHELRLAFDGDAVLFSDEAERVFQQQGLPAFQQHEHTHALTPLAPGPLQPLLMALQRLRDASAHGLGVRTALVTARSAPAHERAIRTLMQWQVEVDEALFLGGLPKAEFLKAFQPDFFFDDQLRHIEHTKHLIPTGHVAAGVMNPMAVGSGPEAAKAREVQHLQAAIVHPNQLQVTQRLQ